MHTPSRRLRVLPFMHARRSPARARHLGAALLAAAGLCAAPGARAALDPVSVGRLAPELRCLVGTYSLPESRTITLTGADGPARALRYTLSSGHVGQLREHSDGSFAGDGLSIRFEPCARGALQVTEGLAQASGTRLDLRETFSRFSGDGVSLHGKLVTPSGRPARALAVWIEGSNNNPSTDDSAWPYELARRGVAVFVYDKRGTGASGGSPTSDFHARARDTAAAVREARRLVPGIRRVGVIGASQGGWVGPLVAQQVSLDFVLTAFGLAEGPIAQDQALVAQQLRDAGFDPEAVPARELTAITERIVRSNLREGLDELEAFKARHAGALWLAAIQPRSYTGLFLRFGRTQIETDGPALAQGLSFDHDPRSVIRAIPSRQLWLLGGSDRQAPNDGTQAVLRALQQQRRDVAVVVFAGADHGLIETAHPAVRPKMADGVFDVAADWILNDRLPWPGRFIVRPARREAGS